MKKRIVSIVGNLERHGTQRAAYRYSSIYDEYYNSSSLLALHGGGEFEELVKKSNVNLFVGGSKSIEKKRAIERVAKWEPNIIHIHREGSGGQGILQVARQICSHVGKKLPTVETNHFARVDQSQNRNFIDLHFLHTKWCLWKWKRWGKNLNPNPVGTVLPLPVDEKTFYPSCDDKVKKFRSRIGVGEKNFLYTRVGSSSNPKWGKCTIKSFKKVNDKYRKTRLLLVNPPSKIKKEVQKLPKKTKNCVTTMGKISSDEKLRKVYTSAQTFVHASSIGESFGMVLAESMLCGTPVVTLNTPLKDNSQVEVVNHKEGGLVAANKSSFSKAMKTIYKDKNRLKKISRKAKKRADKKYSEKEVKKELVSKINMLTKKAPKKITKKSICDDSEKLEVLNRWVERKIGKTVGNVGIARRVAMQILHSPISYNAIKYLR